jgi:hypothetical protein
MTKKYLDFCCWRHFYAINGVCYVNPIAFQRLDTIYPGSCMECNNPPYKDDLDLSFMLLNKIIYMDKPIKEK